MESAKPSVYTSGNAEGIDRVRKEDGAYAFFMEAASIEYHIERKCDLMQLGGLLDSKGYGVALPPSKFQKVFFSYSKWNNFNPKYFFFSDSPYTRAVSAGVLSLQEKGILQKLKTKWWKEMHGGGNCVVSQIRKKNQFLTLQQNQFFDRKYFCRSVSFFLSSFPFLNSS